MGPSPGGGKGGEGAPGMGRLVSDELAGQYQDSKDVLEYLTGTIFTELKGVATDAERDRQRRLQEQKRAPPAALAAADASVAAEEPKDGGKGGFWVFPETGRPGSGSPRSPRSSPPRHRGASPSDPPRGGGTGVKDKKHRETPPQTSPALWTTRVMESSAMTSLRGAMARGPKYDHDGPEDTAAAPLANWPGRDADPKGWHARRKSYARAEQALVRTLFRAHCAQATQHSSFFKKMRQLKKKTVLKSVGRAPCNAKHFCAAQV